MWAMAVTMMQVRVGKSQFLLSAALHAFQMHRSPRENEIKTLLPESPEVAVRWPRGMVPITRRVKMPPLNGK
ncbi:hypothetical protein CEXT_524251 [Caerostris extrusa]|uniref:Secreted protein n=1 Tax=Caerostris extrusa TaxID=172846 RepID=A0AAV4STC1_CAEEX|nr:hypothetical protein CEXT_524251 [Caerostris extrusa]